MYIFYLLIKTHTHTHILFFYYKNISFNMYLNSSCRSGGRYLTPEDERLGCHKKFSHSPKTTPLGKNFKKFLYDDSKVMNGMNKTNKRTKTTNESLMAKITIDVKSLRDI